MKISDKDRLHLLMEALANNQLSEQELNELSELLALSNDEVSVSLEMENEWAAVGAHQPVVEDQVFTNILADPRFSGPEPKKNKRFLDYLGGGNVRYYAAACVVLMAFAAGFHFFNVDSQQATVALKIAKPLSLKNENDVVLTLSNGRQIVLGNAMPGELTKEENAVISKKESGELVYDLSASNQFEVTQSLVYNSISTPVGSTYQLILPDGTKVWLNAMSTLKFPVAFLGTERNVELSGEAYFEVAKDQAKPFSVNAKQTKIRVLGTHFNVSAYENDSELRTSLVEGKVKVSNDVAAVILNPGQQSVSAGKASEIAVRAINTADELAWKNGFFVFRNESIEHIMKKISRWYNIEVHYQGNVTDKKFGGKYLKNNSLSELLSSLALTGTVNFKVDGRRVTVMQ